MTVRGLEIQPRQVKSLTWTANQWELFTVMPGVEDVAKKLNEAFVTAVNEGCDRREVSRRVEKVMREYAKFGADDSEPYHHLRRLLDEVFGAE